MAEQFDAGVEHAIGRAAATIVDHSRGTWSLELAGGLAPAHVRIRDRWFEVSAPVPDTALSEYDDLWALRANARLPGSARVARPCGEAPYVVADVYIEHDDTAFDLVESACLDLTRAVKTLRGQRHDVRQDPALRDSDESFEEIERACREAGWHGASHQDRTLRVEIPARASRYAARLESVSPGAVPAQSRGQRRFVVELVDLGPHPDVCTRAVSTLLMAVSASVRSVKGLICDREHAQTAALAAPLETPLDGSVDRTLSALCAACALAGREAAALLDPQLALEYLSLWGHTGKGVRPLVHRKKGSDPFFKEDEPCLQQP
jgi:hypothetical protein